MNYNKRFSLPDIVRYPYCEHARKPPFCMSHNSAYSI